MCQPLDMAVFKSFKAHLGKVIRNWQCIWRNLWITKTDVPRVLRIPFEQSTIHNIIKEGFRECGIFPLNPNALDKTHYLRNLFLIDYNDLSLPPPNPYISVGRQTDPLP